MKLIITFTLLALVLTSFSCQSSKANKALSETLAPETVEEVSIVKETLDFNEKEKLLENTAKIESISFKEIWGYVMNGREYEFSSNFPITDVGYFVPAVDVYGEMPTIQPRDKFFKNYKGRVHLVTSVDSKWQTHYLLQPDLPFRDKIIDMMIKATETYDGLQIDWELVPPRDDENFWEFLRILKKKLKKKPLTMAIPARTKTLKKDAYAYAKLAEIADRIIIMAYDEHWSTSKPGAIASTDWCERITKYTKTQIPIEKIVMGLSLYGRTWMTAPAKAQAWYSSGIERIMKENKVTNIERDSNGIPHFTFKEEVVMTGWYDDIPSLKIRCKMYKENRIQNIAFWRVGMEYPDFWKYLSIKK